MTDAPEKIWATAEGLIAGPWRTPGEGDPLVETPYTRDDVKEAEKRAEYLRGLEDAAKKAEDWSRFHGFEAAGSRIVELIRALAKEKRK